MIARWAFAVVEVTGLSVERNETVMQRRRSRIIADCQSAAKGFRERRERERVGRERERGEGEKLGGESAKGAVAPGKRIDGSSQQGFTMASRELTGPQPIAPGM